MTAECPEPMAHSAQVCSTEGGKPAKYEVKAQFCGGMGKLFEAGATAMSWCQTKSEKFNERVKIWTPWLMY